MFIRATLIALLLHGAPPVVAEPLISSDASEAQAVVDEKCALAARQRALEAKADETAELEQTQSSKYDLEAAAEIQQNQSSKNTCRCTGYKNQFKCDDGTERYCAEWERCSGSGEHGQWSQYCKDAVCQCDSNHISEKWYTCDDWQQTSGRCSQHHSGTFNCYGKWKKKDTQHRCQGNL